MRDNDHRGAYVTNQDAADQGGSPATPDQNPVVPVIPGEALRRITELPLTRTSLPEALHAVREHVRRTQDTISTIRAENVMLRRQLADEQAAHAKTISNFDDFADSIADSRVDLDARYVPTDQPYITKLPDNVPSPNEWDDSTNSPAPCQPIGCDNDIHLPGCVYSDGSPPVLQCPADVCGFYTQAPEKLEAHFTGHVGTSVDHPGFAELADASRRLVDTLTTLDNVHGFGHPDIDRGISNVLEALAASVPPVAREEGLPILADVQAVARELNPLRRAIPADGLDGRIRQRCGIVLAGGFTCSQEPLHAGAHDPVDARLAQP